MKRAVVILAVLLGIGLQSGLCAENELPDFDSLWDYSNPKATEAKFRELLPKAIAAKDMSYHIQLLTQIARTQGLQRKFPEAHKTLDLARDMLTDKYPVARIRYHLERGRVYNSAGEAAKAIVEFRKAWDLATARKNDFYAVDAAHMLGIAEKPENQLKWNLKAMEWAEKSNDKRVKGWLGPLYNNIGWTYHDMKKYDKALEMFQKSLKWREKIKDDRGARIARWTIGRTYRSLGRIDEALKIQRALEKELDKLNQPDGYVYEELAECLLLKKQMPEARKYFALAYKQLSKDPWMAANEKKRLARLKKLGQVSD